MWLVLPGACAIFAWMVEIDEVKTDQKHEPWHGSDGNWDEQEVPKCQVGDDHDGNEDKKPLSRADEEN